MGIQRPEMNGTTYIQKRIQDIIRTEGNPLPFTKRKIHHPFLKCDYAAR